MDGGASGNDAVDRIGQGSLGNFNNKRLNEIEQTSFCESENELHILALR